jgi:RND family efflux transporter MFP subunit
MSTRDTLPHQTPADEAGANQPATAMTQSPLDWSTLATQATPQALAEAWLAWLHQRVPGIQRSVVMLCEDPNVGQGMLQSVAVRPAGSAIEYLGPFVSLAAGRGAALVQERADAPGHWVLAVPLIMKGKARCVIVLDLRAPDDALRAFAQSVVQAAMGWWQAWLLQRSQGDAHAHLLRARQLLDLGLAVLAQPAFDEAALAWTSGLARHLGAQQVQLAWMQADRARGLRLVARSGAAWHDDKTALVQQALQAMNEAIDLGQPVNWQTQDGNQSGLSAVAAHAQMGRAQAVLALPIRADDQIVGAILLDRDQPFSPEEVTQIDTQALLIAPMLALQHEAERSLWRHTQEAFSDAASALTDSRRPGIKLAVAGAAVALLLAAVWPVTYRVSAPAVVEGQVQRAAVAPFQGFLREARVRAGDVVKQGQVLATLDDKDLHLEALRWQAELEVATRKEREAMASGNRVDQRLASAQANQSRAQLDLAQDRLRRTRVVAPFDGVVVKGDLSQQLGSPVEEGKVLFELAPLDAWRVILKADERDITLLHPGQTGRVVLASLPGEARTVRVKRLTSVAVAEDGRNHFRVEAELLPQAGQVDTPLRPGMEGVAKVETVSRSLLWVWTHRLTDWLRLTWWEWAP